jgi:hypothetical protein
MMPRRYKGNPVPGWLGDFVLVLLLAGLALGLVQAVITWLQRVL